jgi:hypothetical protein
MFLSCRQNLRFSSRHRGKHFRRRIRVTVKPWGMYQGGGDAAAAADCQAPVKVAELAASMRQEMTRQQLRENASATACVTKTRRIWSNLAALPAVVPGRNLMDNTGACSNRGLAGRLTACCLRNVPEV